MLDLSEDQKHPRYEREAVLFTAAVRALGACGYSSLQFDIGGKKSRRRHVTCVSPNGETCAIWIKSATRWGDMAAAVPFPWKKFSNYDGVAAVTFACQAAEKNGATHFLAIAGDVHSGVLSFARLYPLAAIPILVAAQASLIDSVFYRAHSAALIIQSFAPKFAEAAEAASATGEDILSKPHLHLTAVDAQPATRSRSGKIYRRDPKVRAKILQIAAGRCECCCEFGFLTEAGDRYLETHHIVGVSEHGPDAMNNIIAVCPTCHRKAHYSAERVQIERKMLEAVRRRHCPIETAS